MCCCAQKQGQTQVEPFSILLCSCDLCLWKPAQKPGQTSPLFLGWACRIPGLILARPKHLQLRDEPRTANLSSATLKMLQEFAFKELVELYLDPFGAFHCNDSLEDEQRSELAEVHSSDGHQGCLVDHGKGAPSCLWKLEFHYTVVSQEIFHQSTQDATPGTTLGRPKDPRQTPQDVQTWHSCQMCVARGCPGTCHLALSTSCNGRAGTITQIPSQLHFYLKDMGKHPAQNLLSSAPLCLEAEGVFAE